MRVCRCGREFRTWNPWRRLCDVCLEKQEAEQRLVVLGRVANDLEAGIWRDILLQEGIPCMVRDHDPLRGRFQTAPLPYSQEVVVFARDWERARQLFEGTSLEDEERL